MEGNDLTDTITAFYGGNPMGSEEAVAQMKRQPLSSQDLKAQVIRNRQIRAQNEKNRQSADSNADSAKDKNKNG